MHAPDLQLRPPPSDVELSVRARATKPSAPSPTVDPETGIAHLRGDEVPPTVPLLILPVPAPVNLPQGMDVIPSEAGNVQQA